MQQKSNIQLIKESLERQYKFSKTLKDFTEQYDIKDSIFTYINEGLLEVCEGFFEPILTTENINEVINNFHSGMGIRIKGNNYQLGKLFNNISNADNIDKVLEINHI